MAVALWSLFFLLPAVSRIYGVSFDGGHRVGTVTSHSIREASGLCASRIHKDVLYTLNDSGDSNRIFAINATTGQRLATITIGGARAHDWEDIACGPCPDLNGNCIYIADTGGNVRGGEANMIYKIHEPHINDHNHNVEATLHFSWDQHDCETIMVDPQGEVYVVSKVHGGHGKVVHLPKSAWGHSAHAVHVNEGVYLPIHSSGNAPVGGDISPNGREVLLKSYGHVYYWYIPDGHSYYTYLKHNPTAEPYIHERQGESICWDKNGSGYYTVSEGSNSPLYYYRRTS